MIYQVHSRRFYDGHNSRVFVINSTNLCMLIANPPVGILMCEL